MTAKKLLKETVIALPLLGLPALGMAIDTSPIQFDPNGDGAGILSVGTFDWIPGNGLVTLTPQGGEALPLDPGSTQSIQFVGHSTLGQLLDGNGANLGLACMPATCEHTFIIGSGVEVTVNPGPGDQADFDLDSDTQFFNYFVIYYDDYTSGSKSNPLAGTGYNDGQQILKGFIVDLSGNFDRNDNAGLATFDQFVADDYGISSVQGSGSQDLAVLVTEVDPAFFPDLGPGSILPFNNSQILPFAQTNPSALFTDRPIADGGGLFAANLGGINGIDGPDLQVQIDPNNSFTPLALEQACRVTGGGNDTSGIDPETTNYDGTKAEGSSVDPNANGNGNNENFYTFGGQAGANTGKQPQPKGEWTHTQHKGPAGSFTFHAGTASALPGTEIDEIFCHDPGFCNPARPAPTKQISFQGIGNFKSYKSNLKLPDGTTNANVVTQPQGNKPNQDPATYHWFIVDIEDRGEPGAGKQEERDRVEQGLCPEKGTESDPFGPLGGFASISTVDANGGCECPDFYRIRIYDGFEPEFDENGNITNAGDGPVDGTLIYEVYGYLDGGNFQIHPPTGFDLK